MTNLHKTAEEWAKVLPDSVMDGSRAQGVNVLTMALEDIEVMGAKIAYLTAALEDISKGEGAFSRDRLTHATNTIESMKQTALAALGK